MEVLIQNPYSKLYQGEAISVSVVTPFGAAEILENHAKFSAIVFGNVKIKERDGVYKEIDLEGKMGILHTDGKNILILIP